MNFLKHFNLQLLVVFGLGRSFTESQVYHYSMWNQILNALFGPQVYGGPFGLLED